MTLGIIFGDPLTTQVLKHTSNLHVKHLSPLPINGFGKIDVSTNTKFFFLDTSKRSIEYKRFVGKERDDPPVT